jgi:hypothetical protein
MLDGHDRKAGDESMLKTKVISVLAAATLLGGCNQPLSTPQKGALVGGALGTGIGLAAGGSFGAVVGAGLIGGAVGYLGGTAIENSK